MCGQGHKIKMGLQYDMFIFSSETVKEVENGILNQTLQTRTTDIPLHDSGSAPGTPVQVLSYHFLYVL